MYKDSVLKKLTSLATLIAMALGLVSTGAQFAYAAQLTNVSDTLSNVTAATLSNHLIVFTTPTGITAGQTVQITFNGFSNLGQVGTSSIDIKTGASTTTASQINVSDTNGASQWGVATSSNVLTLTAPSSGTLPTAGQVVMIYIGTNATHQVQGVQQITNPAAGSYAIDIAGGMADTGSATVTIISNSTVSATATINQSLSFAILSATSTAFNNTIYYGALSSAAVKFASSTNTSGDTASTTAHVLEVSTNASAGYVITLQGDTLRNQASPNNFINAIGSTAAASAAGTNQFGINATSTGGAGATITATYGTLYQYGFGASTSTADTLAFGNTPTTATTYRLQYMANILATQAAGLYSTAITYVATSNF